MVYLVMGGEQVRSLRQGMRMTQRHSSVKPRRLKEDACGRRGKVKLFEVVGS